MRRSPQEQFMTPGAASRDHSSSITDPSQTLQQKACVKCGATKTPLWRCNVDGIKSLCNRCGVRLYREQKKAHNAEDILDDDDKDDSSSCTYTISGTPFADAQPAAGRRKRPATQEAAVDPAAEDELVCWPSMRLAINLDMQDTAGLMQSAVMPGDDRADAMKRMRSLEMSPYSSCSDDSVYVAPPPRTFQAATSSVIIQAQKALKQAWPSLVTGPLEHLWEAGLDPLDPLFLANIKDPAHHQGSGAIQSEIGLLLGPYPYPEVESFLNF